MNCQQFTLFIVEAARGRMMDAASRDAALGHAESCASCAARLRQEQSLTGALRAVAHGMKDASAPARLEAKLLAAFRESLAQQNAPAATDASHASATHASPPVNVARTKPAANRLTRRIAYAATALAASLALVALATLYLRYAQTTSPSQPDLANNNRQAVGSVTPSNKESALAAPSPPAPSPESGRRTESVLPVSNQGGASQLSASRHARPKRTPTMIRAQHVIDGGNAIIEASEAESVAANAAARPNEPESMTEFISLVADAPGAPPLESGQLVRVQVPRAALASLGLPLNAERGNEPVKADVLLGGDGLARAIRFVR